MGAVDDFINSLEGQEEIDLPEVARKFLELHTEEVSTSAAKIDQLTSQINDKDAAIAERDRKLSEVKAANWDLVNQLPGTTEKTEPQINEETGLPDSSSITLDDLLAE